jgi:glyoxylase-like metal-dependent hydrolase (beta-lactamase superfamily II)
VLHGSALESQSVRAGSDLGPGVWLFQSPLWQTNCLLAVLGSDALLCDPSLTPQEIVALRTQVESLRPSSEHMLITHSDYDHTCGIPFFPTATVVAGEATAAAVADGSAARKLEAGAREWQLAWPWSLRVDPTVAAGATLTLGGFLVSTIEAPGHVDDGLAYLLHEQGVLVAGDYLSPISYPWLFGPLHEAIGTCERLLDLLARAPVRWVVPGHGQALSSSDAQRVGEQDLAYLRQLESRVSDALSAGASPGEVLLRAYSVEPPRPATPDFEAYGLRSWNAQRVAEQLREAAPG